MLEAVEKEGVFFTYKIFTTAVKEKKLEYMSYPNIVLRKQRIFKWTIWPKDKTLTSINTPG